MTAIYGLACAPNPPESLQAVGLDRHLLARCGAPGCERTSPCDPTPWMEEGLGDLPLRAFAPRLRCVCGSRRAMLEIHPGALVPAAHPDIHIFR